MTLSTLIPTEIRLFCEWCAQGLAGITEDESSFKFIRGELSHLLLNKPLFAKILQQLIQEGKYPDLRYSTMFDNELLLYADNTHLFSLRMFLWDPGDYTPVHDHNSWGVIGPVSEELEVINYRREDDGSQEGYARLVETERMRLQPGETSFTLPLNEGIHSIGNPTRETILSLSLYGNPLPRGYINGFDLNGHRMYQIISPKVKKKQLAIRALHGLVKAYR